MTGSASCPGSAGLLRIGTRGSKLALVQSETIARLLRAAHPGLQVELTIIQTTGDRVLDTPLSVIGGKGVFTKEIEEALLDNRVDLAVHSLKDLPTVQVEGLALGAITHREDPRDVLLARQPVELSDLNTGQPVGTSSLRRRAQLLAANPRAEVVELRGNVPTRISRMESGDYAAIILAGAGLSRLGATAAYMHPLEFEHMLPAPGQGSLGLQIRAEDSEAARLVAPLHDAPSAICCEAERALLQALGGGCQLPLGTYAHIREGRVHLHGRVVSLDGKQLCEAQAEGSLLEPAALGYRLGEQMLREGAGQILEEVLRQVERSN